MNGPAEYVEAEPREKRDAVIILVVGAGIGALLLYTIHSQMAVMRAVPPGDRAASHLADVQIIFWVLASVLCAMAAYTSMLAKQVSRAGRFPPLGMKVLRRTMILKGKDAERKSVMLYGYAIFMLGSAAALPLLFEWLRRTLTPQ